MAGSSKEESHDTTAVAGEKHKTDHDNSNSKRQKTEKQSTLEEVLGVADERKHTNGGGETDNKNSGKAHDAKDASASKNSSAVKPAAESDVPSSILEKGIIYFFIRGRVGIEDPSGVGDIARTYFLLRPIEKDAKLGKGPIGDAGNTRVIALPKKVFPRSGKDRFMTFVDKSGASYDEIKKEFLSSSDYETKTAGTRHTPAATPVGEGVYALTSTGRESHLVYMLTLPEKRDEVQDKLGLKDKGSFIVSTKNPKYDGPPYAQLPEPPMYPKEIIDEFRSLRWLPSKAEHFNYVNSQILLVGESSGIEKATEVQEEDRKDDKADPEDVLNQLEEEDLKRMKDLPGGQSASIFADLEANAEEYPKLQTTF